MNNLFSFDEFPEYKKLRESQPYIQNQDFIPVIVNDIFDQNETEHILEAVKNFPSEKIRIQKWGGQGVFDHIQISENIKSKIQDIATKAYGEELVLAEFSVVKYSPEYGYEVKLFPHYDTRPFEMFVFDIQIKTNEDWGIVVEGNMFNLLDNQAILFSGTQQMHWRENKKLSDNAEILMIFCWLKHKTPRPILETESSLMLDRQQVLQKETKILSDEILRGSV